MFADEMRLGQVRRVWGRRGEKQRRRIELRYAWVYLVLGVNPMKGRLWWDWVKGVRGVERAQVCSGRGMGPYGLSQGEGGGGGRAEAHLSAALFA
jgi:hypothetical protein